MLSRSGMANEALSTALEVLRSKPADMAILTPLAEVFRRCDELGYFVQMFDQAAAERPQDVEIGRQLCFAWARVEDYRKLQAVRAGGRSCAPPV